MKQKTLKIPLCNPLCVFAHIQYLYKLKSTDSFNKFCPMEGIWIVRLDTKLCVIM